MTTENQPGPFKGFSSPTQEDIDVALADQATKVEHHGDGSTTEWYGGADKDGKPFAVAIYDKLPEWWDAAEDEKHYWADIHRF